MLKFNQYHVTDGTLRAKVSYSLDNHIRYAHCVTLYARDYSGDLGKLFKTYVNDTDTQTDYFDKGHVTLIPGDYFYPAARHAAETLIAKRHAKRAARKPFEITIEPITPPVRERLILKLVDMRPGQTIQCAQCLQMKERVYANLSGQYGDFYCDRCVTEPISNYV